MGYIVFKKVTILRQILSFFYVFKSTIDIKRLENGK